MKTVWAAEVDDLEPGDTLCADKETAKKWSEYGVKDMLLYEVETGTYLPCDAMRLEWRDDTLYVVRLHFMPSRRGGKHWSLPAIVREDSERTEHHVVERTIFESFDELVQP